MKERIEKDSMGTVRLPGDAYYGPQTQRARENFPISGIVFPLDVIHLVGRIKQFAARVNHELGRLNSDMAQAIEQAAREVARGDFDQQFIVDVFQTGSATSSHMNVNEVIACRANEILTGEKKGASPVHPNDHVNLGQSSNDVMPSALRIAAAMKIADFLVPGLKRLYAALSQKSEAFVKIEKIGRTHLQDAVPVSLGQEFSGFARQVEKGILRIREAAGQLLELPLGGTAVGTGLNTSPDFGIRVIHLVAGQTGLSFVPAENRFEAQAAADACVYVSGSLKTVAVSLMKMANDIRWLSSGPRCGIGEITIPSLQPGSSIMPGKVNPVVSEAVIQAAIQVIGHDTALTWGGRFSNFQLNTAVPLMAHNLLSAIEILGASADLLAAKCVGGILPNKEKCRENVEKSLAMATLLTEKIGYDAAAEIAKTAHATGKTVREVVLEENRILEPELNRLLKKR